MSYLRCSYSDWYVYRGDVGLCIILKDALLHSEDKGTYSCLSLSEVKNVLSGETKLETIIGWGETSIISRRELLWALREYVAMEEGEDLEAPPKRIRCILKSLENHNV